MSAPKKVNFLMCFLCFCNLFIFYQEITSFPSNSNDSVSPPNTVKKVFAGLFLVCFAGTRLTLLANIPTWIPVENPAYFSLRIHFHIFSVCAACIAKESNHYTLSLGSNVLSATIFLSSQRPVQLFFFLDPGSKLFQEKVPWAHTTIFQEKRNWKNPSESTFYNVALKHKLFIFKRK